jgi:hypothetical protein
MLAKEATALGKCHAVTEYVPHFLEFCSGWTKEAVVHRNDCLRDSVDASSCVDRFMTGLHGSHESVLDREHSPVYFTFRKHCHHITKLANRHWLDITAPKLKDCFFTKCA